MFKKIVLKNGLRVVVCPMPGTNTVTVLALIGTGSKYESKEKNGISHFLEHMLFKGTTRRPTSLDISMVLDSVGGEFNAFTGKEYTGYYAKVDVMHQDLAFDLISDMYSNSLFAKEEIQKEKGVIIEEINMYEDMPMRYVAELFDGLLYKDQPAGWLIAGSKETVSNMTRNDFVEYVKSHYSSKNTVLVLAGNISEADMQIKAEKYFGSINDEEKKNKQKTNIAQSIPEVLLHFKESSQTHLALGVRTFGVFDDRKYALDVLSVILGGNMSSRLFIEVREKEGLAYYVRSSPTSETDCGYLLVQAGTDNSKVERAIEIILKEFKRLKDEELTSSDLQKAKDYIKGSTTLELESSDAVAGFLGMQEVLKNEILTPQEKFAKIDAVSAGDIKALANEIFTNEKLNLAIIGPFKEESKFKDILKL